VGRYNTIANNNGDHKHLGMDVTNNNQDIRLGSFWFPVAHSSLENVEKKNTPAGPYFSAAGVQIAPKKSAGKGMARSQLS